MRLNKIHIKKNWNDEYTIFWYNFSVIQKNINLNINQEKYIKFCHKLYNEHWVKKISFNDLFKFSIIKGLYDEAIKDENWYMIYNWNEVKEKYQLIKLMSKITPSKYKNWWLLELSTEDKYIWKWAYKFSKLWKRFLKDVLNII